MESRSVLAKLVEEDFGLIWRGGRWARAREHDSLVIDLEKDLFFWNSEDIAGTAKDYLLKVRKLNKNAARDYLVHMVGGTPQIIGGVPYVPYEDLVEILWRNSKNNREYWYTRKLNDNTIDRFRLGFFEGWNTIPLYLDGRFINFQCRRDLPDKRIKSWYKSNGMKPVLFNSDILKFTDTVFITEGLVDCILLSQFGIPSVSKNIGAEYFDPSWFSKFCSLKNIYYIADNDRAGVNGAKKVVSILGSKVKVFRFKDKKEKYDTGDFFKEDGTPEEYVKLVEKHSVLGTQKGDF